MASEVTEDERDQVWLKVFARTMRERGEIPGSASEPENRLRVAVSDADSAAKSDKAVRAWLA